MPAGIPSLSTVASWKPEQMAKAGATAANELANSISRANTSATSGFTTAQNEWAGSGATQASSNFSAISAENSSTADSAESMAEIIQSSLSSVSTSREALLQIVASAFASGLIVNNDWKVTPLLLDPVMLFRARTFQATIIAELTTLVNADREAAREIQSAAQQLTSESGAQVQQIFLPLIPLGLAALSSGEVAGLLGLGALATAGTAAAVKSSQDESTESGIPGLSGVKRGFGKLKDSITGLFESDDDPQDKRSGFDTPDLDPSCTPRNTIEIDGDRYPETAQHTAEAIENGQPMVLQRDKASPFSLKRQRGNAALRPYDPWNSLSDAEKQSLDDSMVDPKYKDFEGTGHPYGGTLDRDEYPPKSTYNGGAGADVKYIDPDDNSNAGRTMYLDLEDLKIQDGQSFCVVPTPEDSPGKEDNFFQGGN